MTMLTYDEFTNLEELRKLVDQLIEYAGEHPSTINTGTQSIRLYQETLTDGSFVYNVRIYEREA